MKKSIVFLLLLSIGCNSQNKPKEMKATEQNTTIKKQAPPCDHLKDGERDWHFSEIFESDYNVDKIKGFLNLKNYKYPDKNIFRKKIKEIFNIDVENYVTNYQVVTTHTEFPYMVLRDERIVVDLEKIDDIPAFYDYEAIVKLNKMLFYNDIEATNWYKIKYPKAFTYLIKETGYTGNKDWLKFAFAQEDFSRWDAIDNYLLSYSCEDGGKTRYFRPKMLNKMIELGVELSHLSDLANRVRHAKEEEYAGNNKELYAYLMERCYKAGQWGIIEAEYDNNDELKNLFNKYNYFGNEDLKDFTENSYIPREYRFGLSSLSPEPFHGKAVINDPDGYTNLRDGKSTKSKVRRKIYAGEVFAISNHIPKEKEWWYAILADGSGGWIHKSRVQFIRYYNWKTGEFRK